MKVVLLHGLGQTAQDWEPVVARTSLTDVDCLELFSLTNRELVYPNILAGLEKLYAGTTEPFALCGLSLGAVLALDYTIRHRDQVSSLILIGAQYQVPSLWIDLQNLIFRCMPNSAFDKMGLSKSDAIALSRSMRALDFSQKLNEITCPVTILCGVKDHANLKASRQMKRILPQSELYMIPGVGHEVNKCKPEAISAILNHQAAKKAAI